MSTLLDQPHSQLDGARHLTLAEFAALPSETKVGPVRHELDNGVLITMLPPGDLHSVIESNLVFALKVFGEAKGYGKARVGEVGIILRRSPDRVVGADAAFIKNVSLPVRRSPEGYLETIPELVIEVVSKHDRKSRLDRKVQEYLTAGVRLVMVVDPQQRTVALHRAGHEAEVLRNDDRIQIDEIIPGFNLTVAEALAD